MDNENKIIATCASGLELLLQDELAALGGKEISQSPGAVTVTGNLETAYRACLWSRFAARILLPLKTFDAPDTDALYKGFQEINWYKHFTASHTFAVDCVSRNSSINHTRFAALRAKDAIVDQFRDRFKRRPSIDTKKPHVRIYLFLDENSAAVSIDLSGDSLHKRGYRSDGGEAPLKESLAAAIVKLSGWDKDFATDRILLDPMCGSGTLLIEAALIYGDIAPGLDREYFGFLGWKRHNSDLWEQLVKEAVERRDIGLKKSFPKIIGYDADPQAINNAFNNVKQAGLAGIIHVEKKDLASLKNPVAGKESRKASSGLLVVNPPYGERLSSINSVRYLYRCLGRKMREKFSGWSLGFFSAHADLSDALDMHVKNKYRLYNGPIPCQLRLLEISSQEEKDLRSVHSVNIQPLGKDASDFANRLRKNLKQIVKWANCESISCYRIYDADMPEYNVAVDIYGQLVHVQEYAPPKSVDIKKASQRLKLALSSVRDVLGAKRNKVFVKTRHKQKGKSQYQKKGNKGIFYEVWEGNCRLLVNLLDYLDTGLFLDHRIIRSMIQEKAEGKRFLNLFSYTGSATVHAAMGGAKSSVSVDLSPIYLEWARSNLALNGFSDVNHRFVQSDCLSWIKKTKEQFNLILVDPPTFSNSKRTKRVFDVQRDHVELIKSSMKKLDPEGLLIFSTNFRRFKIDNQSLTAFNVEDKSHATIPMDFKRNQRIHQCWFITHKI